MANYLTPYTSTSDDLSEYHLLYIHVPHCSQKSFEVEFFANLADEVTAVK